MELTELLKSVEIDSKRLAKEKTNTEKLNIKNVAYHSKEVSQDTIFVCIKGHLADGHQYAEKAVAKGAVVIVVERFIKDLDVLQVKVKDSREALATISSNYFKQPSKSMHIFGITATNGKTTITYMTDEIFKAYKLKVGLIGTIITKIDNEIETSVLTTPESYDLQKYFAKMEDEAISHVSMEVSSSALELKRVHKTAFDVVAFTNISPEHIRLHESFEAYFDAKSLLIRNAPKNSFAILNIDEPILNPLVNQTEAQVVTFGIENSSGIVKITDIDLSSGKPSFTVNIMSRLNTLNGTQISPEKFKIQLSVPGYHSIYNATTAILTALINNIPLEYVKKGIENFKGVERRFQILYDQEFKVIDDLLLNKNNIDSCMEAIGHLKYENMHLVHAIRGSNGPELSEEIAESIVGWFNKMNIENIILTTSRSHVMKKDEVTKEELEAFLEVMQKNKIDVAFFEELDDALQLGVERLNPDDILLISGAHSMDTGAKKTLDLLKQMYPNVDHEAIDSVVGSKIIGMG
ncbi:Mur ligase family protein [Marinilactibacillus psychrotolerans]|uniref:UDP-N-acetylmuramoylalanyl-D-glutamate--2, 6-diaminopimelate ligase n=1 Tax=Marinilactibacillus psychrotolerans TaxID=191770 RepID=A0AAV3WRQ3_9LACT|nr:UDP-N-acetylmuramyl-tripeptide synthetase [Marinilactibacillus psychrotolerans]GEQ35840.1 UDP-N-acetylmuramoylalanyl-D-glutamate--2, 6-diaminopimelate ligase [Marinilactibacillus psychrotolerans]